MLIVNKLDKSGKQLNELTKNGNSVNKIYRNGEVVFQNVTVTKITAITLDNLVWTTNIPASGGTATKENCTYSVTAYYSDGTTVDVTSEATITGSQVIPSTNIGEVHSAGTLTLTASYRGFTATGNVTIYQEAVQTFLPYVIFTGQSYVNTGILPDLDTRVEMYGVYISQSQTYNPLFGGCNNDVSGNWFRVRTESSATNLNGAVGNDRQNLTFSYPISGTVILDKTGLYYNQQSVALSSTSMNTSSSYIYIHTDNRKGNPTDTRNINMQLSEFKIYKNDVLVCDLKGKIDDSNQVALYDTVTGTYKYNIGSGGLVAGQ